MNADMQAFNRRASRRFTDGVASNPLTVRPEGGTK
jgi:hypothetical protein